MAAMTPADRARRLLEEQVNRLAELRNAHTRDPQFKQWRQATLTAIQRIWPGEASKSERFRRVPFSTPSSKSTPTMVREVYERGCAEAANYLRTLLAEIDNTGLPIATATRRSTERPVVEDDFPVVDLPGGSPTPSPAAVATHEAPASAPAPVAQAPPAGPSPTAAPTPGALAPEVIAHLLELGGSEPLDRPQVPLAGPPAAPTAPPAAASSFAAGLGSPVSPVSSPPAPAPSPPGRTRAGRPSRRPPKPPLKEMLGFTDDHRGLPAEPQSPGWPETPTAPETPIGPADDATAPGLLDPAARGEPEPPEPLTQHEIDMVDSLQLGDDDLVDDELFADESSVTPPEFHVPEAPTQVEPPPADDAAARLAREGDRPSPQEAEAATAEFMLNSPVLKSRAKPVRRVPPPESRSVSPTAAALEALAAEVANLGVPEGQRAGARAALLDLARQLDDHSLDWDGLRRAFGFVMEYRGLARRVIPLLIPYLDSAA